MSSVPCHQPFALTHQLILRNMPTGELQAVSSLSNARQETKNFLLRSHCNVRPSTRLDKISFTSPLRLQSSISQSDSSNEKTEDPQNSAGITIRKADTAYDLTDAESFVLVVGKLWMLQARPKSSTPDASRPSPSPEPQPNLMWIMTELLATKISSDFFFSMLQVAGSDAAC